MSQGLPSTTFNTEPVVNNKQTRHFNSLTNIFGVSVKSSAGFTLIELVIYTAGMVALLAVISGLIVFMYTTYRDTTIGPRVDRIGVSVTDRVTKDIRTGVSFNTGESQFGVATGALSLNAQSGETLLTKYIALQSGRLIYQEDDGDILYLTPEDLSVSSFNLTSISTPVSEAIRFSIGIDYTSRGAQTTRTYSGVSILRHSYE